MKRIYIINGIFNIMLGIMGYLPFILGYMLCNFAIDNTMMFKGIGIIVTLLAVVIILNFILYIILNKFFKKPDYIIRKKLYFLISMVMFLLMLLISTLYMSFM